MGLNLFFSNGTDILETHPKRKTKCYPPKHRRKSFPSKQEKKTGEKVCASINRLVDILPTQREAILSNILEVNKGDVENLTQDDLKFALEPLPFVYGVSPNVDKTKLDEDNSPAVTAYIQKMRAPTIISLAEILQCLA